LHNFQSVELRSAAQVTRWHHCG